MAAVRFARTQSPHEPIGVLGISLRGAAALLSETALPVQGMILEAVYTTMDEAIENRLAMRLGPLAPLLAPLLVAQLDLQFEVKGSQLRPIDKIRHIECPLLVIAGSADRHTTLAQSRRLFEVAPEPKEFWALDNVAHVNFHQAMGPEYESRILEFFHHSLR